MATGEAPVERLRGYLLQLPPAKRALLIAELERSLLRGDDVPGGDLLLQEVRGSVRESAKAHTWIYTVAELRELFASVGLVVEQLCSSGSEDPFRLGDPRLLLVARKEG